jgi:hypothetical protein
VFRSLAGEDSAYVVSGRSDNQTRMNNSRGLGGLLDLGIPSLMALLDSV